MLKLSIWRASLDGQQAAKFWDVVDAIPEAYARVLTSSRQAMANAFGLRALVEGTRLPDRIGRPNSIVRAEVFSKDGLTYVLALRNRSRAAGSWSIYGDDEQEAPRDAREIPGHLYLYVISNSRGSLEVPDFCEAVKVFLGVDFKKWEFPARQFMELKQEGRRENINATPEKIAAAQLLCSKGHRVLATAIKSSLGGLILSDVEKQLKREKVENVEAVLTDLQSHGLISSEYVIVCAKSHQQVARVGDVAIISEMSQRGVRCGCGRKLEDERPEEAVAITDLGRELLDKSTWMSVILVDELHGLGVPDERIMIEYSSGGDEMDCIADINGELVLFELKDKEFSLREAYSFGAKIGLVRPKHPVIVTTEKVGGDAKEHFQKAQLAGNRSGPRDPEEAMPIRFIEGVDDLRRQLEELASSVHRSDAQRILRDVIPLASISPQQFLDEVAGRVDAQ
ncbi:hypothetical protein SAMN06272781_2283 [Streptomyces sp. 1222.2]|uniref:hypothetical protein n=1 Tax=Streptomyces sp. 1222.2 TaxID=1938833 RepID=UPI000BCC7734|nr:hypothetical protein [Streptomyces sp. 1222.2]SOD69622.1 hypothetical protein SAMN06272781_2283 [Streptomyces sp. 1222.2]